MTTYSTKLSDIKRVWHLIDAQNQVLGRLATQVAVKLMGKYKPYFTKHLDCGDYVVIINSDQVAVTGRKKDQKKYYRHSNFPGGFKSITLGEQLKKDSRRALKLTISKMLPKNKLREPRLKRLKIFKDNQHPYQDKIKKV
ncbi:MAG: 50S ribosomal protein L13 [Candidatus Beckwithbacteria bacterium GW2011_GWA2_43_10]|uniref:Large ribosomal subunit protein uL13 n=1 Tax=Candidatus Beckwithbacteria bacterium GW2011_GWA2_43_10 TaxID=1618369 RepID=A0A0G1C4Q3_9BACT|nr:MAG: 50S ribosomal protein L13 [Candidatus Beckwithbacteria bacterium GW2011_GWA2_43_10]